MRASVNKAFVFERDFKETSRRSSFWRISNLVFHIVLANCLGAFRIKGHIQEGRNRENSTCLGESLSNLFLLGKKDRSYRSVINLKIAEPCHFISSFQVLPQLIQRGD